MKSSPLSSARPSGAGSWAAALVVILACAAAGAAPAAEAQEAVGMAVSVVQARRQCLREHVSASGTVAPVHEAEVRAGRDGMAISQLFVEAGDVVAADQVLARLLAPQPSQPGEAPDATVVRSPIRGTVASVAAPIGSYASPSARDPMFRIVDEDALEVRADVLASKLPRLHAGQPATIHVVGLGDVTGAVSSVGTAVDGATQSGVVALAVSDRRLRVGAFARADIAVGEVCGLAVPLSALLTGAGGLMIEVVRANRVEMRPVSLLLLDGGQAAVQGNVKEGDQVVAQAGAFLRNGDPVRPMPATKRGVE